MVKDIKWDTEELHSLLKTLNDKRDVIARNKDFLVNIDTEIEKSWQGMAGKVFDDRLDHDTQTAVEFINAMDVTIEQVNQVIRQYTDCENEINSSIRQLGANMKEGI